MIYNFTVCNYSCKIREKNLREYNYILFTLAQKKSNVEIIINIYYQNAIKPMLLYINITNSINITHLKRWGLFWKNYFQWFILAIHYSGIIFIHGSPNFVEFRVFIHYTQKQIHEISSQQTLKWLTIQKIVSIYLHDSTVEICSCSLKLNLIIEMVGNPFLPPLIETPIWL